MRTAEWVRAAVLVCAPPAMLATMWVPLGPDHPALAANFAVLTFGILGIAGPWPFRFAPRSLLTPRPSAAAVLARLGIPRVLRALDAIGWNRLLGRGRHEQSGRAGLATIRAKVSDSLSTHALGCAHHLAAALAVTAAGAWASAAVLVFSGAILHGIPVLLQRYTLARLAAVPA